MWQKGDIIEGFYNYPFNGQYFSCTSIGSNKRDFIKLEDISSYNIELFEYNINNNLSDSIEVLESLNDNDTITLKKYENINKYINDIRNYDLILLNQEFVFDVLHSYTHKNNKLKYLEGLYLKDTIIPMYLLPKDKVCMYLLNSDLEGNIVSYKKIVREV